MTSTTKRRNQRLNHGRHAITTSTTNVVVWIALTTCFWVVHLVARTELTMILTVACACVASIGLLARVAPIVIDDVDRRQLHEPWIAPTNLQKDTP